MHRSPTCPTVGGWRVRSATSAGVAANTSICDRIRHSGGGQPLGIFGGVAQKEEGGFAAAVVVLLA